MDMILQQARASLLRGRMPLLFPEGTRSKAGEKGKYHPGVAMVYDELKVPLLPIALNTGVFWPCRSWKRYSGHAVIEILPPIPAGLPVRTALKQLEQAIEEKSQELFEEAIG
jgi:1-acyl-sn-glycerol-3-phosphate acyltransferase